MNLQILDEIANKFKLIKKYGISYDPNSNDVYEKYMFWYEIPNKNIEIMEYSSYKDMIVIIPLNVSNIEDFYMTDDKEKAIKYIADILYQLKQETINERLNKMEMDFK